MSLNWGLLQRFHTANGTTRRDRLVNTERQTMLQKMPDAPYCYNDVSINGVQHTLNILDGDELCKKKFHTLPTELDIIDLGDYVEWMGSHWIVTEIDAKNAITKMGRLQECNLVLRWQNFGNPTIIERHCVLDSGVYSTTLKADDHIVVPDAQYKVYLPYDEDTKKLYIGKRFATETAFDASGDPILRVYEFTAFDSIADSYGTGRLLIMKARAGVYIPGDDNVEQMICNYVAPAPMPEEGAEPTAPAVSREVRWI